jgi:hypothetical protein
MTTLRRQVVAATVTKLSFVMVVSILTAPLVADAQPGKVHRIGYLSSGPSTSNLYGGAFQQGLSELGWVEGQNIVTDYRFAEGRLDRLPLVLAREPQREPRPSMAPHGARRPYPPCHGQHRLVEDLHPV